MADRYIAMIGSRDTSCVDPSILDLYDRVACMAAWAGYTVISGAAEGFDRVACTSTLAAGGKVKLVLPWRTYEREWYLKQIVLYPKKISIEVYDPNINHDWTESVWTYHPQGTRLTQGAYALHARNFGIIKPASLVIAVPNPGKVGGGGTGQGLRIAEALNKRLYDLTKPESCAQVDQMISRFENTSSTK